MAVKGHRGLVVEVKTSVGRAPACERLSQSQRERLWHIAELVVHHHDLLSAEVTLALVTLRRDHEALQWVTLDPY